MHIAQGTCLLAAKVSGEAQHPSNPLDRFDGPHRGEEKRGDDGHKAYIFNGFAIFEIRIVGSSDGRTTAQTVGHRRSSATGFY